MLIFVISSTVLGKKSKYQELIIKYDKSIRLETNDVFPIFVEAVKTNGRVHRLKHLQYGKNVDLTAFYTKKWKDYIINVKNGQFKDGNIIINRADAHKGNNELIIEAKLKSDTLVKGLCIIKIPYIKSFEFVNNQNEKCKLGEPVAAILYAIYNTGERANALRSSINQVNVISKGLKVSDYGLTPVLSANEVYKEVTLTAKSKYDEKISYSFSFPLILEGAMVFNFNGDDGKCGQFGGHGYYSDSSRSKSDIKVLTSLIYSKRSSMNGGNGTDGLNGKDAEDLWIFAKALNVEKDTLLKIIMVSKSKRDSILIPIKDSRISILCRGGHGGYGGNGGDGADQIINDIQKVKAGYYGDAGNGGNGGNGGDVYMYYDSLASNYSNLFEIDNGPGIGGKAGRNGKNGIVRNESYEIINITKVDKSFAKNGTNGLSGRFREKKNLSEDELHRLLIERVKINNN